MKFLANILTSIYNTTVNTNRWIKFVCTVVLLVGAFVIGSQYYSKTKVKPCEDCAPAKAQVQQLINALIDVRTGIKELATTTSYEMDEPTITFMYASYDSMPKKKLTQKEIKMGKMITKLDSTILDALRKQQRQKQ